MNSSVCAECGVVDDIRVPYKTSPGVTVMVCGDCFDAIDAPWCEFCSSLVADDDMDYPWDHRSDRLGPSAYHDVVWPCRDCAVDVYAERRAYLDAHPDAGVVLAAMDDTRRDGLHDTWDSWVETAQQLVHDHDEPVRAAFMSLLPANDTALTVLVDVAVNLAVLDPAMRDTFASLRTEWEGTLTDLLAVARAL